ncbi:hypothetical protein SELMODRAFT_411932 [Selaginella moellendorffii]|uniref:Uncharacterized protein n=1 Tax=Selaginella moellendorffii TaxID=88036 RepID=D8RJH5_SELML|nr:hypothetical protein SELMODRAFT_411932 [Selaginella moellendorffii]
MFIGVACASDSKRLHKNVHCRCLARLWFLRIISGCHGEKKDLVDVRPEEFVYQKKLKRTKKSLISHQGMGVTICIMVSFSWWETSGPAAINSAIVTTGFVTDNSGEPIKDAGLLSGTFGGNHINPNAAAHPGLVYDAKAPEFTDFLCGLRQEIRNVST